MEKFGYGFGFIGNMVYMMQQLAPGRSTMTHYAFATALMNFVLVPTTMISGPLAEWLGFSTFFLVVCSLRSPQSGLHGVRLFQSATKVRSLRLALIQQSRQ